MCVLDYVKPESDNGSALHKYIENCVDYCVHMQYELQIEAVFAYGSPFGCKYSNFKMLYAWLKVWDLSALNERQTSCGFVEKAVLHRAKAFFACWYGLYWVMNKAVWHVGIAFIMPDSRTIVCMEQKNVRPDISFLFYYPFFHCLSFFILQKLYVRIFFF